MASDHFRSACCSPTEGMNLARLNVFLDFLANRLAAADFAEAQELLHAAVSPIHAARRAQAAA